MPNQSRPPANRTASTPDILTRLQSSQDSKGVVYYLVKSENGIIKSFHVTKSKEEIHNLTAESKNIQEKRKNKRLESHYKGIKGICIGVLETLIKHLKGY